MSAAGAVDKLTQLVAIKADIYAALAEVGAPVQDGQTFAAVPDLIRAVGSDTVVPLITVEAEGALTAIAEPTIGDTIALSPPTFAPNDAETTVAFQLQRRIPGQAWEDVAHDFGGGAYTFGAGDMGRQFTGLWTASRPGFASRTFRSAPVAPLALTFISDPLVSGLSRVGDTLSVATGVYPCDATLAFQWRINGVNIADETDPEYAVLLADHGKVPSVLITATDGAQSVSFTASAEPVVHAAPVVVQEPGPISLTQAEGEVQIISVSNVFDGIGLTYFVVEFWPEDGDDIPEDPEDDPVDLSSPFVVVDPVTGALSVDRTYLQSAEITLRAKNSGGEAAVDFLVEIIADAGEPAAAPPALTVSDWTISASLQTPITARGRVVLTGGNPAEIQWTKAPSPSVLPAATIFVATTGSDAAAGTEVAPYATWQKAIDQAGPGDVIEIAGGTYTIPAGVTWKSAGFGVVATETAGTALAPIIMRSKAGARAVLDFSLVPSAAYAYGFMFDASHWRFERLDFTGWTRDNPAHFLIGVGTEDNTNTGCQFTECRFHGFEGVGFAAYFVSGLTLTDCDSFENDDAGAGNADGFSVSSAGTGCSLVRCRAFDNGDDGFDLWDTVNPVTLDTCWSFRNGWQPGTAIASGDGNGFKLGRDTVGTGAHVVTNCLAAANRQIGFDFNGSTAAQTWVNCTALDNGLYSYSAGNGQGVTLLRCVAFGGTLDIGSGNTATDCSWTTPPNITIGEADFVSTGVETLDDPRGFAGTLPSTAAGVASPSGLLAEAGSGGETLGWALPADQGENWRPMVPDNGAFLTFCPEGTCEEPVGTAGPYYLRYRNDPVGLWSAISDGKTFTVTAASLTPAAGSFAYDLFRGTVNSMNLRQAFVADFAIEITIDDADMPQPFAIDAAGIATVTVAPDEVLGERTVTVTAAFVGGAPAPVPLEPMFVGENYAGNATVALPVDMLEDDIVVIAARGPDTMPIPAGFTALYDATETFAGTVARLVYAWKRADSPVMASGTWTGATRLLAGVYRNLDPVAPFGDPVNGSTAAAGVVTYPAVPDLGGGAWVLCLQYTQASVEPAQHPGLVPRRTGPNSSFNRLRLMDSDGPLTELAETTGTAGGSTAVRLTLVKLNPKAA